MEKKYFQELIGLIGTVPLHLPVIQLGNGQPHVLITSTIHGDEWTGLFILQKLIERLHLEQGQLTVLPIVNPLGFAEKVRINPIDGADLNRSFGVSKAKLRFSHYIAETVKKYIDASDLIIDVHVFGVRRSLTTVIQHDGGNKELNEKNLSLIKRFQPKFIWRQNVKTGEIDKTGTLLGYANDQGKMCFGVEYTIHFDITEQEIEKNVQAFTNVLHHLGLTKQLFDLPEKTIPVIERLNQVNDEAGIFVCSRKLGEHIAKNETVGQLMNPATLESKDVISQHEGILFSFADRELMNTSEKLFTLGKVIDTV